MRSCATRHPWREGRKRNILVGYLQYHYRCPRISLGKELAFGQASLGIGGRERPNYHDSCAETVFSELFQQLRKVSSRGEQL